MLWQKNQKQIWKDNSITTYITTPRSKECRMEVHKKMINVLPFFFLIVINQSKHKATKQKKRKHNLWNRHNHLTSICKFVFVYIWSVWNFQMIYKRWCFPFLKIKRKLHRPGPGGPGGASEGLVPAAADQRQAEQQQQAGGQSDRGRRHHVRSVGLWKGSRNIQTQRLFLQQFCRKTSRQRRKDP